MTRLFTTCLGGSVRKSLLGVLYSILLACALYTAKAQPFTDNVGIGTSTPNPSAILELQSNDKGFLITRMSQAERNAISLPATGLMIYNTTTNSFQYNIGVPNAPVWVSFLYINIDGGSSSGNFWSLFGNDSVDRNIHYLGTNTREPLIIKTDLDTRATFTESGELELLTRTSIDGWLDLLGDTTSLRLNGNPGSTGAPLISRGVSATPAWYTGLVLGDDLITISTELQINATSTFESLPNMPLLYGSILVGDSSNVARPVAPGLEGSLLQVFNGTPQWISPEQANYWSLAGNGGTDANAFLGTTDANDLRIATDGTLRATFTSVGTLVVDVPTSISGGLTLTGSATPLFLDADPGLPGQVVISQGPGITPRYTDSLTLQRLEVLGESFFRDTARFDLLPLFPLGDNFLLVGDSTNTAAAFPPGGDSTFLAIFDGEVVWFDLGRLLRNTAWIVGGNVAPGSPVIGNLDTTSLRDLDIVAGNRSLVFLDGTDYTVDVRGPFNLDGSNIELRLDGNPGVDNQVLVSRGPGQTPAYTDSLWITQLQVAGESFFGDTAHFNILPDMPLTYGDIIVGDTNNRSTTLSPGLEGSVLQVFNGTPVWISPDEANYWSLQGNVGVAATDFIGTTDANDFRIATDGTLRATFTAGGTLDIQVPTAITGSLTLFGTASPLILDTDAGQPGSVLISQGAGVTPRYTDSLRLAQLEVTGTSLFADTATFNILPVFPLDENYVLVGNDQNIATPFAPGADSTFLAIINGDVTWYDLRILLRNQAWIVGGNDTVSSPILGVRSTTSPILDVDIWAGGESYILLDAASQIINLNKSTNLAGDNIEFRLNGDAGLPGQVLVSNGPGATPRYTDTLVLGSLEVTGESFFRDTARFDVLMDFPMPFGTMLVGDTSDRASLLQAGLEGSVLQVFNGTPVWVSADEANYWSLEGNTGISATDFIGTTDANDFRIATDGTLRATFTAGGGLDVVVPTTITGGLTLVGANTPLILDANPGTNGQVLVSNGPGQTPRYTDSLSLFYLELNGPSVFNDTATFTVMPNLPLADQHLYVGNAQGWAREFAPGADSTVLAIVGGQVVWYDIRPLSSAALREDWQVGGNEGPFSPILGVTSDTTAIKDLDLYAGGQRIINLDGTTFVANVQRPLNLDGANVEFRLNGNPGTADQVLVSNGPGVTPRYTDSLTLSYLEVTGESFFRDTAHFDVFMDFPLPFGHLIVGDTTNKASVLAPGLEGAALQVFNGTPQWVAPDQASFWSLTGNTGIGPSDFLGTTDANDLRFATNGTLRMTLDAAGGVLTVNSLGGAPATTPLVTDDGIVVADAAGTVSKRDKSVILAFLGIQAGRYVNTTTATEYTVVITLPVGFTLDANASITITPEASSSVSAQPFIISGSRTPTSFSINFPGGLDPGEAINYHVQNPF